MRFVPAPADCADSLLGVVVHRGPVAPDALCRPAHALAITSVVLQGRLGDAHHALGAGSAVASGSASQGALLGASDDLVAVSLLCRASVLPRLCGEPAHVFTDTVLAAADLWGKVPLEQWAELASPGESVAPAVADDLLARSVLDWAGARLRASRPARASARRFAQDLGAWAAAARPAHGRDDGPDGAAVRPPPGWSARQWQRACRDELGLRPGQLLRLLRLHASLRVQTAHWAEPQASGPGGAGAPDWAQHAVQAGYSDQPHLAREYRALTGLAPGQARHSRALALGARTLAPRFFGA